MAAVAAGVAGGIPGRGCGLVEGPLPRLGSVPDQNLVLLESLALAGSRHALLDTLKGYCIGGN